MQAFMNDLMSYHEPVYEAIRSKSPIVALESTVIAHGLPYPHNLEVAVMLEDIVRKQGATPATIAVKEGKLCVGLSRADLELLAKSGAQALKLSHKDIGYALTKKLLGATTVSATMRIAHMAGIAIFATGGIGGVHRGGHISLDISADLIELSKTNVAVVCAGAKSILDLGRTLEYLETFSVPVIGYNTHEFPAFYSRSSGHNLSMRLDSAEDCAHFLKMHSRIAHSGVLIANPIAPEHEIVSTQMETWIEEALTHAQQIGIHGPATTPFLLKNLFAQSGGKTLEANIALLKENARLAADIAVAYHNVTKE
jgi:pseudouridylate synthase